MSVLLCKRPFGATLEPTDEEGAAEQQRAKRFKDFRYPL
jgi:hypothetical protein